MTTTTPPLIIALMGKAGAGKDTAAEHLAIAHQFEPYALATPIKTMVQALLTEVGQPDAHRHLHHRVLKELPIAELCNTSPRQMAQTLGTEWGRQCLHPDFWLRCADMALGLPDHPVHGRIVISDLRFANEAAWVRAYGGVVIRITRSHYSGLHPVRAHVSESEQDDIIADHHVRNDATRLDLYDELDMVMAQVLAARGMLA